MNTSKKAEHHGRVLIDNNGRIIKGLIKEAGLTQQQFADKMQYTLRAVQKWCLIGVNDYHVLAKIADCLEVAIEDLIFESGASAEPGPVLFGSGAVKYHRFREKLD